MHPGHHVDLLGLYLKDQVSKDPGLWAHILGLPHDTPFMHLKVFRILQEMLAFKEEISWVFFHHHHPLHPICKLSNHYRDIFLKQ